MTTTACPGLVVTIIAYKRAEKLRFLLDSLRQFPASQIHIFCDGARGPADSADCQATQEVAREHAKDRTDVHINIRESNLGLNENIIQSITSVLSRNPFTLVLEEDVIPEKGFAEFIFHFEPLLRERKEIFSISGYHPCNLQQNESAFLSRRFFCWGWATWADRWNTLLPLIRGNCWPYEHYWEIPPDIGTDFAWAHRQHRMGRRKLTWDRIVALWTLKLEMLHLCPCTRLTTNIGLDGSGENCTTSDPARRLFEHVDTPNSTTWALPQSLSSSTAIDAQICKFFTNSSRSRWDNIRKRLNYELARLRGLKVYEL